MAALVAPPGAYRLRVVANDASGRGGTVDDEIRVELGRAGSLKLSALALAAPQGRSFSPALEFHTEPAAVGYLEIYGVPKTASVSVAFEMTAADDGRAVATTPAAVHAASDAEDVRIAVGAIASLPPGDFVVRALVSLDGQTVGAAVRTLRKADRQAWLGP